ncbi:alpha/beta hydrolase [Pseudorhodoplanes sp.]|uniref:alpha/beta hydrolase n=1 Tax=Pseudorhodoplanes sp. TaxID=1934341 RepID=UPI002C4EBFD4|nr:alpha/beta hydrolase [Pseudorhodoplanes sp.]HWV54774.1 alpha/beta hydrolase [Pseudorhodoplanes sp.]
MAFSTRPTGQIARFFVLLLAFGGLAAVSGCASAPGGASAFAAVGTQPAGQTGIMADPIVTAVTTRNPVKGAQARPWFGTQRANQPSNVRIHLSSPAEGAFSTVGLGDWGIKAVEIVPVGESFSVRDRRRDVLVYIHGFNQSFETAVLDAARLSDGLRFHGETMLFSWPSKNSLMNYIYDRESALWSRDALEGMFDELIGDPTVGTVHVVAHSMGTMVAVESLRQLYDRRGAAATSRFGAIVLASPDIDMDSFTSSVSRIGTLSRKITVLTVANDRALGAMRDMAGGVTRVGIAEKPRLEALGVRVIDASDYAGGGLNHDLFMSNAQVRETIRRFIADAGSPAYSSSSAIQ